MRHVIGLLSLAFLTSCNNTTSNEIATQLIEVSDTLASDTVVKIVEPQTVKIPLDSFFVEIDTNFHTNKLIIPGNLTSTILFTEKVDQVVAHDGRTAPAKKHQDMIAYLPIDGSSEHGWLYIGHETNYGDDILGDGGGATMFEVKLENGGWNVVSDFNNVDFSPVRGTARNCGGSIAPNGMIYTCEEIVPQNNRASYIGGKGHRDTSDVGGLKFHENFGFMVEVDPNTMKATQKMIQMGRYYHEDIEFMDDRKTVYLSDDYEPAIFYKFVADVADDYSQGQLFAYKQSKDGTSGDWLAMPMDTASLLNPRDIAIDNGATMLMRHEWFARVGNNIYIAETGHDSTDWTERVAQGGVPAKHLRDDHYKGGGVYTDYYGRVLVFDTETNKMSVHLDGGVSSDGKNVLSNPDCISTVNLAGTDYLIIHEDINGNDYGRVSATAYNKNHWYNELYFLDLSIENPTVDDAVLFAVTPMGAEFTGGLFTPDGKSLFLNIQHPFYGNGKPFNRSMTVVVTGW